MRRAQKLALTLIASAILYGNLACLIGPFAARSRSVPALPTVAEFNDFFHLFGVFSSYERVNREVHAEGWQAATSGWVKIDIDRYIRGPRGVQQVRLWASRPIGRWTPNRTRQQRFVADKLRARYNRDHPSAPIDRVRVYQETWPRSTRGFYALKRSNNKRREIWYEN